MLPQGYRPAHSMSALFSERFVSLLQNSPEILLCSAMRREENESEWRSTGCCLSSADVLKHRLEAQ